jgi:hypothetical protein
MSVVAIGGMKWWTSKGDRSFHFWPSTLWQMIYTSHMFNPCRRSKQIGIANGKLSYIRTKIYLGPNDQSITSYVSYVGMFTIYHPFTTPFHWQASYYNSWSWKLFDNAIVSLDGYAPILDGRWARLLNSGWARREIHSIPRSQSTQPLPYGRTSPLQRRPSTSWSA